MISSFSILIVFASFAWTQDEPIHLDFYRAAAEENGITMTRSGFGTVPEAVGGVPTSESFNEGAARTKKRKLKYLGWQVGLTYQVPDPSGLDRDYLIHLLDEMEKNGMNMLSLMMISYGYYDPRHDGYCWPVQNPKLRPNWDPHSTNGSESTEFVSQIIEEAAARNIEIQLMMNWGIWTTEKIKAGYPSALTQQPRKGDPHPCLHCPDSKGAWQAGLDEVEDLLMYHDHPNVTSFSFERISYASTDYCYCVNTQEAFQRETGHSIFETDDTTLEEWKKRHIGSLIQKYIDHIKKIRPTISVYLHTQCAKGWGHDPASLRGYGVDFLQPHTIQFQESKKQTYQKLDYLAPNPCVLHFCTRDRRPKNYNLWIKNPEIITETLDWVHDYPGDHIAGILFFNEPATSQRNKETVYDLVKRFHIE